MKQQRMRFKLIALIVVGLIFAAGGYGVYSVSTYGNRWFSSARNARYREAKSSVVPGDIIDRNGIVVASSDAQGKRVYQSSLASRSALAHLIGDSDGFVANGVDSFESYYLLGFATTLTERVGMLVNGQKRRGDNVTLTVDSRLCTEIVNAFNAGARSRDRGGGAVVMNYKTGELLALVSLPVFDPQNITDAVKQNAQHPFWNRATQSTLPPGSTFKIITAASALQNLSNVESLQFTCTGATRVMDQEIHDYNHAQHNTLTLARAFRVSCNNVFAQTALIIGDEKLRKTAEDFGFNDNFLFRDLVVANSTYPTTGRDKVQIAWSGVGQSQVAATPLHMCMAAAGIANGGVMMEPRLLSLVESPSGIVRLRYTPKVYKTACDPELAKTLEGYMKDVVANGTGTAAKVDGLTVAGKTGSAEGSVDGRDVTHAWFVGYIVDDALPYACAVLVEEGESGGAVAAPIAKAIFSYLSGR